jgi:hypothetical protein
MRDNQHTWFIISGITGVLFIIWGAIATEARPLIPGDLWIILPGSMLLIIGIVGILEGLITDMRILRYFSELENEEISSSQAAEELNMDAEFFQQRILALKISGKLAISFIPTTGIIIKSDITNDRTCNFCAYPNVTKKFCPVCGTKKSKEKAE